MAYQKAKIRFYQTLATMLEAGVPLVRALQQQQHHPAPFSRVGRDLASSIENEGCSFGEAACDLPAFFDTFEVQLIRIGEQTGSLDAICRSLSEWYEKDLAIRKKIIAALAYPCFLFHVAAIALPFLFSLILLPDMAMQEKVILTGAVILCISALPYILFLLYKLAKACFHHILVGPLSFFNSIFLSLPVFGSITRKLNYSRFFYVYSLCLNTGLPVADSVRIGASVCNNHYLRQIFLKTADDCETNRCPFFEAYAKYVFGRDRSSVVFPVMETGETTGKTAESAHHLAVQLGDEAESAIKLLATVLPLLLYIVLVIVIACSIIAFAIKLFASIYKPMGL